MDFKEAAYVANFSTNVEFNSNLLRFAYSSLSTPNSTFDYDLNSREKFLKKQQEVVGDFESSNYETRRLMADTRDGIKVPISLVFKKDTNIDGTAPLLLYAYGSYGHSTDPNFNSIRLSLLDRGFVYAIAPHQRGRRFGKILVRRWQTTQKEKYFL